MRVSAVGRGVLAGLLVFGLGPWAAAQSQEGYVSRFFPGVTGAGARAMGMGGAFIAIADDATAASWNPAGLAVLERPEVAIVGQPMVAATIQQPSSTYTYHEVMRRSTWTTETTATTRYAPYAQSPQSRSFDFASFTVPLRVGALKLVPQISYQRVVDLGFGSSYGNTGQGQRVTVDDPLTSSPVTSTESWQYSSGTATVASKGGIDVWAATVAVSFTPKLYLGLGLNRWGGHSLSTTASVVTAAFPRSYAIDVQRTTTVTQDFSGTSVHLGALVKPTSKLSLGLAFRPRFGMKLNAEEDYRSERSETGQATSSSRSTTTRDGTLRWPQTIGAGLALMPTDFLTVSADFARTSWSKAEFNYTYGNVTQPLDSRGQPQGAPSYLHVENQVLIWPALFDPNASNNWSPQQTDASQVRVGLEYVVKNPQQLGLVVVPLRVGFIVDGQMTMNAPTPSRVAYYGFTAGLGLVWKRVSVDFAWVHTTGKSTYGFDGEPTQALYLGWYPYTYDEHFRFDDKTTFTSDRLFVSTVVRF